MPKSKQQPTAVFGPQGGYMPGYGAVPPTNYNAEVDLTNCRVSNASPNGITVTIPANNGTSLSSPWTTSAAINTGKVRVTDQDIEIDGLSLKRTIEKLYERMAILVPNPALEQDFEQLRELRNQYEALERELKEKSQAWNTLKNTDTK